MHSINIHNKSDHDQEFEVHGFNDNKNIVVKPGSTTVLQAADKASGAIIALHDGHEGEQAEITKDGFEGNHLRIDFAMTVLNTCLCARKRLH